MVSRAQWGGEVLGRDKKGEGTRGRGDEGTRGRGDERTRAGDGAAPRAAAARTRSPESRRGEA